jgi:preprotein translocase subunit YajC
MDILIVLIAVLAAFYFILMKPVINQQKRQRQDISSLGVGDEVLTTAGFYATVVEINTQEDGPMEILLEVAPGVILRGTTLAIQEVSRRASAPGDEGPGAEDEPGEHDDAADSSTNSTTSSGNSGAGPSGTSTGS